MGWMRLGGGCRGIADHGRSDCGAGGSPGNGRHGYYFRWYYDSHICIRSDFYSYNWRRGGIPHSRRWRWRRLFPRARRPVDPSQSRPAGKLASQHRGRWRPRAIRRPALRRLENHPRHHRRPRRWRQRRSQCSSGVHALRQSRRRQPDFPALPQPDHHRAGSIPHAHRPRQPRCRRRAHIPRAQHGSEATEVRPGRSPRLCDLGAGSRQACRRRNAAAR